MLLLLAALLPVLDLQDPAGDGWPQWRGPTRDGVWREAGIRDTLLGDELTVDGSRLDLVRFFSLFDKPDGRFGIVVP